MTTSVSVQLEKGGFPKCFWPQPQESVFAPIPCGVSLAPHPCARRHAGTNGSRLVSETRRGCLRLGGIWTPLSQIVSGNLSAAA